MITYGSVCSGIEAATTAWHPLGWSPRWFAEIEPFPSAVLAHHWPDVPNLGDFTAIRDKIAAGAVEAPDVLVGGTPCQAFSIAGLRQSLDDKRGQLTLEFVRLADAIDSARSLGGKHPVTVVWENVPGVLTTPDNAFGCFLAGLVGEDDPLEPPGGRWTNAGYVRGPRRAVAWRILDAQYFGVAQRRRRVFVVASARAGFDPTEVLFEFDGVRRDSPPRRETGKGFASVAGTLAASGDGMERPAGNANELDFCVPVSDVAATLRSGSTSPASHEKLNGTDRAELVVQVFGVSELPDVAHCLRSGASKADKHESTTYVAQVFGGNRCSGPIDIAPALNASASASASGRLDFDESGVQFTLTKTDIHAIAFEPGVAGRLGGHAYSEVSRTLRKDAGDNQMAVAFQSEAFAVSFSCKDHGGDAGEIAPTMRSMGHHGSHANGGGQLAVAVTGDVFHTLRAEGFDASEDGTGRGAGAVVVGFNARQDPDSWNDRTGPLDTDGGTQAVAFAQNTRDEVREMPYIGALAAQPGMKQTSYIRQAMQVRRLTPTECERLQGFPDGHTLIPWRGKPAEECPDGPRYKALGNSMAVPVMRWIGERIAKAQGGANG